ncbi:hypothetical protein [Actinoallomurus sp. CA-150999]|uniref:hypothetical protein n=1 Tax=Actinoallomurus sp. CA-150999 TaxID=3239887 RepID=UPI003D8E2307
MRVSAQREKVRFAGGGVECAGRHYPGTNGACVIMGAGGGVTKEPGTDPFARCLQAAGFGTDRAGADDPATGVADSAPCPGGRA